MSQKQNTTNDFPNMWICEELPTMVQEINPLKGEQRCAPLKIPYYTKTHVNNLYEAMCYNPFHCMVKSLKASIFQ
jgi:hypothetical protein